MSCALVRPTIGYRSAQLWIGLADSRPCEPFHVDAIAKAYLRLRLRCGSSPTGRSRRHSSTTASLSRASSRSRALPSRTRKPTLRGRVVLCQLSLLLCVVCAATSRCPAESRSSSATRSAVSLTLRPKAKPESLPSTTASALDLSHYGGLSWLTNGCSHAKWALAH